MIINRLLNLVSRLYIKLVRKKDIAQDISIISNNCWAGAIYQDLSIPFNSPTIGLFFYAPCYIAFLQDLENNLNKKLSFTTTSKYKIANLYRLNNNHFYPIGKLDDIEIHFLHYVTIKEASKKWGQRTERVNFGNLFIKMCDRDLCTNEHAQIFDQLPYNKVFFSSRQNKSVKSLIMLKAYKKKSCVGDIFSNRWAFRKQFNPVKKILKITKNRLAILFLGYIGFILNKWIKPKTE